MKTFGKNAPLHADFNSTSEGESLVEHYFKLIWTFLGSSIKLIGECDSSKCRHCRSLDMRSFGKLDDCFLVFQVWNCQWRIFSEDLTVRLYYEAHLKQTCRLEPTINHLICHVFCVQAFWLRTIRYFSIVRWNLGVVRASNFERAVRVGWNIQQMSSITIGSRLELWGVDNEAMFVADTKMRIKRPLKRLNNLESFDYARLHW